MDHRSQLGTYDGFCPEIGEHLADITLAWLLHQPVFTAPIIGLRTVDQFHNTVRAVGIKLGQEELQRLDEIWPGPGGIAPKAYAW